MNTYVINGSKIESTESISYVANPKRAGKNAHARYEQYQEASTLEEYFAIVEAAETKKAVAMADLRYDLNKGYLKIVDETSIFDTIEAAKS